MKLFILKLILKQKVKILILKCLLKVSMNIKKM